MYKTFKKCLHLLSLVLQETSHLQPISTLPADIENKGRMLLIVSLSSPGMVEGRSHGKRKYLDSVTKANIYNTLVAWFLSLVSEQWLFFPNICQN